MIDLTIHDDADDKFALVNQLASMAPDLLPPVYIMSHNRSDILPTLKTFPLLRERAQVVVREQEMERYEKDLPGVSLLSIPAGWGGTDIGVGRAHQFVLETADLLGQDRIMTLDDDITQMTMLYGIGDDRVSRAFLRHVGKEGKPRFQLGVLVLLYVVAEEAFRERPDAMIASPQNQNANRTTKASEVRWQVGTGSNPGLMQVWAVDRFQERVGGIDLERFYRHGDDVGALLQIVQAGGEAVKVPTIIGDSLDCETRSVVRSADNAATLRQAEHDALKSMPLGQYVKTKTDFLDRPQWHSLDWKALRAAGLVEHHQRLWVH